jgi:hypothetical protein
MANNGNGMRIAEQKHYFHQLFENEPIITEGRKLTEQPESGPLIRRPGQNRLIGATAEVTARLTEASTGLTSIKMQIGKHFNPVKYDLTRKAGLVDTRKQQGETCKG